MDFDPVLLARLQFALNIREPAIKPNFSLSPEHKPTNRTL